MMLIKEVSQVSRGRHTVLVDNGAGFVLYTGELKKYHIREGEELTQADYEDILENVLAVRAKKRILHLLERSDRTEKELRERLERDGYPGTCIDAAVAYAESFGYLDDSRYIENFIRGRGRKKSRKELEFLLLQKGFSREDIKEGFENAGEDAGGQEAIRNLMEKKRFVPASADKEKTQKMVQYLLRKGFQYQDIRQVIQISSEDA